MFKYILNTCKVFMY